MDTNPNIPLTISIQEGVDNGFEVTSNVWSGEYYTKDLVVAFGEILRQLLKYGNVRETEEVKKIAKLLIHHSGGVKQISPNDDI